MSPRVVPVLMLSGCCLTACGYGVPQSDRPRYPPARVVPVVDDYHGTKVADPYRWLEDHDSPEVRSWASAQNVLFESIVRKDPAHSAILDRLNVLAKFWDDLDSGGPSEPPPIDDKTLGPGRSVDEAWRSPDGRYLAYTVSEGGSEWVDLRVRRLADGADEPDSFAPLIWTDAIWTADSRGFFYVRYDRPGAGERTAVKNPAVFYHRLGTQQANDTAVFTAPAGTTNVVVTIQAGGNGRYLFISEGNGAHVQSIGWLLSRLHILDLGDATQPVLTNTPTPLSESRDAAYHVVGMEGGVIYLFTDRGAPRRRLVAVDLRRPAPEHWRDVIAESADLIDGVGRLGQRWIAGYVRNVQHAIRVFALDGRFERELPLPSMRQVVNSRPGDGDDFVVTSQGWTTSPERARFNLRTGEASIEHRGTTLNLDVQQVWYPAKDAVRIPMYLVHRRDLGLDGSHPVLLHGYGASSQLALPEFAEHVVAAAELGFVVAVPALRGGGEFGREWYEAATLGRKQTTFDDFIAAAEYLIAQRYTSAGRIAIQGASNGGLLVTAVLTQRPELFRAAVAEVPLTDAIRYDRGRHLTQFGSPANPDHFKFLHAYSPQHQIKAGTCYPATLITASFNDDRNPAWMPLKFTAALQAAQGCPNPILLRTVTDGGHFGEFIQDAADALTFIVRELRVGR